MKKLKTAVIGVGYLGKFHAEKFAALPQSELIAVCDADPAVCQEIADRLNVQVVTDYKTLLGQVEAVSIVVPTKLHCEIAKFFLTHGVHVLVEKPITHTLEEADELIQLAEKNKCILQVGHLERFNSAVIALQGIVDSPRFIESHRLAPFNIRGTDVNVVLDLMIHDIDIIQCLLNSPIKQIDASGIPILTDHIDIANARIRFANGCVANVTASRVSMKTERKMRIFQHDSYLTADFHQKKLTVFKKLDDATLSDEARISQEEFTFEQSDALLAEIEAFLNAITNKTPPLVSGHDGRNALATAIKITELMERELQEHNYAR